MRDAPVAQMDRAPDFESVGRVFESPRACCNYAPIAQLVEQRILNPRVEGSSPSWRTKIFSNYLYSNGCQIDVAFRNLSSIVNSEDGILPNTTEL